MRSSFPPQALRPLILATLALFATVASGQTPPPAKAKPLDILLVGASGMIGSRILTEAASRGHHVTAASRHPEKIAKGPNITAVKLDATDKAALTALAKNADAIVMATAPRSTGNPIEEAKALGDAGIAAAKATGKRLLIVGGAASLNTPDGKPVMDTLPAAYRTGEPLAMRNVLDTLKASDINWTFFSPAMSIRPGTRTGKYRLGTSTVIANEKGESRISAEDFAAAVVNELENPKYLKSQMTIGY
ncbi:MAG: NAD(P)H-binding protein [Gammaproteobacteria bacterium]